MKSAAKKTISLMLTLLMVLGMVSAMPATVWAAGNIKLEAGTDQSGTGWSWNGSSNTLTLSGAELGAVEIVPDASIVLTSGTTSTISASAINRALKANGSLHISGSGALNITNASTRTSNYALHVLGNCEIENGELTLQAGQVTGSSSNNANGYESVGFLCDGNLTISGGTLTSSGADSQGRSFGIRVTTGKDLTISGNSTVVNAYAGNAKYHSFAIANSKSFPDDNSNNLGGNMTISGGTVTAIGGNSTGGSPAEGIFVRSGGVLELSGGYVTVRSGNTSNNSYGFRSMGRLIISGGVLDVTSGKSTKYSSYAIYANETVTITGGMIAASANDSSVKYSAIQASNGINMQPSGRLTVFNQDPSESFESGTTISMHQGDYSKPLRIGAVPFYLSTENDGRGSVNTQADLSTAFYSDDVVSFTASPNNGYLLNYWAVNGEKRDSLTGTAISYTVNSADGDAVIKAFFRPEISITGISISGERKVGSVLTAEIDPAAALEVTYQWYRDGQPIEGATGITYTAAEADLNSKITVKAMQYGTELEAETQLANTDPIEPAGAQSVTAYVIRQKLDGSWSAEGAESSVVPSVYQTTGASMGFTLVSYSVGEYKALEADRTAAAEGANINAGAGPLYLYYARNSYDLVFYSDTAGTVVLTSEKVLYGTDLSAYASVAPPQRENDTFAGWATEANIIVDSYYKNDNITINDGLAGKTADFSETVTGNTSFYPIWIHDRLAIVIDTGANDVSLHGAQSTSFTVNLDEKIVMRYLIAASRPGFDLAGWYTKDGVLWNGSDWNKLSYAADGWVETAGWGVTPEYCDKDANGDPFVQVNEIRRFKYYTVTLTAHWTPKNISVNYDAGSDGTADQTADTVMPGGSIVLPGVTPNDPSKTFTGWLDSKGALHSAGESFTFTDTGLIDNSSITFTAQYIDTPAYSVTFDTDGGSAVAPVTISAGDDVYEPAVPTKTGHTFTGWTLSGAAVSFPYHIESTASAIEFKASWQINSYTISFESNGGSPVDPITEEYGSALTPPSDPVRNHYTFSGWSPAFPGAMPAENSTLSAVWAPTRYTVTFMDENSELETISDIFGAKIEAPSDPVKANFTFTGWDTEIPAYMPDTNPVINACWKQNQAAPAAPDAGAVSATVIRVNDPVSGYEYSIDGGASWLRYDGITPVEFGGLIPNTSYDVICRIPGDNDKMDSPNSGATTVNTPRETQAAPDAPNAIPVSPHKVSVNPAYDGMEYVIVAKGINPIDSDWANAKTASAGGMLSFDNLSPDTEYDVYARMKGTNTQEPSPVSEKTSVRTLPADLSAAVITLVSDTVDYSGTPVGPGIAKVELNGVLLNEGVDYIVSSGGTATEPGNQELIINGTGYYTGTASKDWSISKIKPALDGKVSASAITYGQSLADSNLSGSMSFGGQNVPGTFAWKTPSVTPSAADSGKTGFEVIFTPTDTERYETVELTAVLAVAKADRNAPEGLTAVAESIRGSADGKITGANGLEYRKAGGAGDFIAADPIDDLEPGTYEVRFAEDENFNASPSVNLVVDQGPAGTASVITDSNGTPLAGVTVQLVQGNEVIAETTTNAQGEFALNVPAGDYNLVAIDSASVNLTKTQYLQLTGADAPVTVQMPPSGRNSLLDNTNAGECASIVDGLDSIAAGETMNPGEVIEIQMTVTSEGNITSLSVAEQTSFGTGKTAIQALPAASGQTIIYLDLKLEKTVTALGAPVTTNIGDSNTTLLTIRIPFIKGTKENITVYRYHGTTAEAITTTPNANGEYIVVHPDNIELHAMKFSAYAIGYVQPAPSSSDSGSGGPVSPKTVTAAAVASPADTGVAKWLITEDHIAYIQGRSSGDTQLAAPEEHITRAETAMIFYRLLRNRNVEITASFPDIKEGEWYEKAVNVLGSMGIVNGRNDGLFDGDANITRAEFAAIATRFAEAASGRSTFSDVPENYWAYGNIATAASYGWVRGYNDGTFLPKGYITRAEVAAIVNRMLGRSADEKYVRTNADKLISFPDMNDSGAWYYLDMTEAANSHSYTVSDGIEHWK